MKEIQFKRKIYVQEDRDISENEWHISMNS